jgi:hypothetical protein
MHSSHLFWLIPTLVLGAAHSNGPWVGSPTRLAVCPAENATTRSAVYRFLLSEQTASDRQQFGMTGVDTSQVRLLADSADLTVCQYFTDNVDLPTDVPRVWAFYKAGSFYFIASDSTDPTRMGVDPLLVLDNNLSVLGSFGM